MISQPPPGKSRTTWFTTTHLHQTQMTHPGCHSKDKENFPTGPLDDDIWLEDPVPDRHLCIHEQSQPHYQCSYSFPYSLYLPHSAPDDGPAPYYKMMDPSDISDFRDVMMTTSDEDIPDLEDFLDFEYGLCFG